MSIIKNAWLGPLDNPRYLKPYALKFKLNGVEKTWELAKTFDSVAVLIYNKERKVGQKSKFQLDIVGKRLKIFGLLCLYNVFKLDLSVKL